MTDKIPEQVRLDKWLWAVRLYRSRSLATGACNAGHVKVEGQRVKPSRDVRVGEVINPRTRRLPVEIELADHGGRLRPGLVARFSVQTGAPRQVIQVPLDGVFERFGSQHVYVVEDSVAQRRAIVLGPVRGGQAEVVQGLRPGELVVSKGVTRVVDGSKVRVIPEESTTASTEDRAPPSEP